MSGPGVPPLKKHENVKDVFKKIASTQRSIDISSDEISFCVRIRKGTAILAKFEAYGPNTSYYKLLHSTKHDPKKPVYFRVTICFINKLITWDRVMVFSTKIKNFKQLKKLTQK